MRHCYVITYKYNDSTETNGSRLKKLNYQLKCNYIALNRNNNNNYYIIIIIPESLLNSIFTNIIIKFNYY